MSEPRYRSPIIRWMKQSTRDDWDRVWGPHYPGSGNGIWARTAAVNFWLFGIGGAWFLGMGFALDTSLVPGIIGLVLAAVFAVRWVFISRHRPDEPSSN